MQQSLLGSVRLQIRVIAALIMRELHTRYGRENIGFIWFIGEPLVFTLGVVVLWSQTRSAEHGVNVISFTITGYTPLVMWRHCFGQAVNALKANGSLLYHRQISFLDIVIARCLIEIAGSILCFTLSVIVFGYLLRVCDLPTGNYLVMLEGWLLFAWFCFSTALLIACVTEMSHVAEKLAGITGYIMIPVCGAFWMVDWLPDWLHDYVLFIPSVSAFEMIRTSYFGPLVKTHYDPMTACMVCGCMTAVGLMSMRKARNHLAVE